MTALGTKLIGLLRWRRSPTKQTMKPLHSIFTLVGLLAGTTAGLSQGFINLNFESANLTGYSPGSSSVPVTSAFPGWQVYYGSSALSQVWYDGVSLGGNIVSIWDTNTDYGTTPLQGRYSATLFSSVNVSSSISQSGTVPVGTQSLILDIYSADTRPESFAVSLGGQVLTLIPLSVATSSTYPYTVYEANVSSFAGLANQQLNISAVAGSQIGSQSSEIILDNIQFSPTPVPEPSGLPLAALGTGLAGLLRWQRSRAGR